METSSHFNNGDIIIADGGKWLTSLILLKNRI